VILLEDAMTRRICYLTGTRADFGLMSSTLHAMAQDPRLDLRLLVTGMHLSPRYGYTVDEIEAEGFVIAARQPVELDDASAAGMAINLGRMLQGFVPALQAIEPDVLLLLGDRGEMLAGAIAAIHLGIPIAHLHGGERSGTVDEPVRHAISKLAHLHFVATQEARDRLVRMGEQSMNVHVVGAPGVDGLVDVERPDRATLCLTAGFDPAKPIGLMVYHPVLQEAIDADRQVGEVISATEGIQLLALMPNSDAGSEAVRRQLTEAAAAGRLVLRTHLPREEYIGWLSCCDVLLGNSSSGIIEAASFGTPVVNIGTRQNLRERNANVMDVPAKLNDVRTALTDSLAHGRYPPVNVYGDGQAGRRVVELLATTSLTSDLMAKCNAY
jgi:GDP/UDP-N,N'-diacetylbacillosamine 2-epimerase (hydrolysing)